MSDYVKILFYYYETLNEEEFLEKVNGWALRFIRYMKQHEQDGDGGENYEFGEDGEK